MTRRYLVPLAISLWLLAVDPARAQAAASDTAGAVPPGSTSLELEEVEVIGKKAFQLQHELVRIQERFYTRYNDLNQKDDFDIHCQFAARTGTRVQAWECKVAFLQDAATHQAQERLLGFTRGETQRYVNTPEEQWVARRDEYVANVRAVSLASPELRELAIKWRQLQERYDQARKVGQ